MGHHTKRDPIPQAESLINERIPIFTAESSNNEQTSSPIVTAESLNKEQAPWHNDLFETPQTYETKDLHEWSHPPPMVSKNPKGYGEMGKILSSIKSQIQNIGFQDVELNYQRIVPKYKIFASKRTSSI